MPIKGSNSNADSPNPKSPFSLVPFAAQDLGSVEVGGGGGKELVKVDTNYRQNLHASLLEAQKAINSSFLIHPNTPSHIIFKLRDKGIAKSHRPTTLIAESNLLPAGHGDLNECIVGVTQDTIIALSNIILNRNTKSIRANLSAISSIEAWTLERKLPYGKSEVKKRNSAILQLFSYFYESKTKNNFDEITSMLKEMNISFSQIEWGEMLPLILIQNTSSITDSDYVKLISHPSIRTLIPEPKLYPFSSTNTSISSSPFSFRKIDEKAPIVGVFDTGVSPNAHSIKPWVKGSVNFVLPPETNYEHGTSVASLIIGAAQLNHNHDGFPDIGCQVFDVVGLESQGGDISTLIYRLEEVVKKNPDIKVWNLSLGAPQPCDQFNFSEFAVSLDSLSDKYEKLFIVAAGNYIQKPIRNWPVDPELSEDRVSSPGESIRALTVGSIAHIGDATTLVGTGHPTPYSRRGPGPVFTPKPDIVHFGGNVHSPWAQGAASTKVVLANNTIGESFGTSFAAPIVSAVAAKTWDSLNGHPYLTPNPALIKALLIHSAQLSSPPYTSQERRYYGAGLPKDVLTTLYDRDDSFTLVFEAQLVTGAFKWRKSPYPIPTQLINNGKFQGEIIITCVYTPPLDPNYGSEYVRANVELSFGLLEDGRIKSKVPVHKEIGANTYEAAQVENGGKWSPIKIHRKSFPNGVSGDQWALQASATLRAYQRDLKDPIPVYIIVTLRSLDGDDKVNNSGIAALAKSNWITQQLPVSVPIRI